jgi:hypothetical protein
MAGFCKEPVIGAAKLLRRLLRLGTKLFAPLFIPFFIVVTAAGAAFGAVGTTLAVITAFEAITARLATVG